MAKSSISVKTVSTSRERLSRVLEAKAERNKDIQEAIENGVYSTVGCRVKEPKLWEERYW